MSGSQAEVTYTVDFRAGKACRRGNRGVASHPLPFGEPADSSIPGLARLMALAIRFDRLLRDETIRDYAELARLCRVTRARISQIMKLLDPAPQIQEQILFLPNIRGPRRETCGP